MKKLTKILAVLLACITVFSTVSMAADGTATEEVTTAVQEETTTAVQEETTTSVQEETTTSAQEETTTEAAEETTAPDDETTTTTPDVTEPDVTEPTDPTDPEKPEIVLPAAPERAGETSELATDGRKVEWSPVAEAEGYNVYLDVNGEWVLQCTTKETSAFVYGLLKMHHYKVGVRSYITVDGVQYESAEYAQCNVNAGGMGFMTGLNAVSIKNGIKLSWRTYGVNGYELYVKEDGEWKLVTRIEGKDTAEYTFENAVADRQYEFRVRAYVMREEETFYSDYSTATLFYTDHTKAVITFKNPGSSTIALKWQAVEGAASYRVYIYKDGKWKYYKGITKTSYTIKDLEASTKYKIKVRACFKNDGKVTWGAYSDEVSVRTDSKKVKSYRVGKLKKYFTDGDWSVKVAGLKDKDYGSFDYTLAVKGNKIFVRYDFKSNKKTRDFEYLIDIDKEKAYIIFDDNKTYAILKDDEAYAVVYSVAVMAAILDMSTAKNVTAKTTVYSDKTAVAEIYTDKELGVKKTYYFINDKVKALKVTYSDGSTESFKISKINDTPSSSVFKVPSKYKQIKY